MPAPFARTMRSLSADGFRRMLWALVGIGALLAGWLAWMILARVTVYEVALAARIEVGQAAAPIAARVAGRVVESRLALGQKVEAGDLLVELDAEREALALAEERSRLEAVASQMEPVRAEITVRERALAESRTAGQARIAEARARYQEAEALAAFSELDAARTAELQTRGVVAARSAQESAAAAKTQRAAAQALRSAVTRAEAEDRQRTSELDADLARLRRDLATLEAQRTTGQAAVARLEHEVELRRIRAPVAGHVGEAVALQAGAMLAEGERIGAVIPAGDLAIVAEFAPAAIGRLQVGQAARLRLDGFPAIQYGTIPARVTRVGSEPRDGQVRVELALEPVRSAIVFQHGLPGTVEVAVERVSPALLVLRAIGRMVEENPAAEPP